MPLRLFWVAYVILHESPLYLFDLSLILFSSPLGIYRIPLEKNQSARTAGERKNEY